MKDSAWEVIHLFTLRLLTTPCFTLVATKTHTLQIRALQTVGMAHTYSLSCIFSPSLPTQYFICTLDTSHILKLRYLFPTFYVVSITHTHSHSSILCLHPYTQYSVCLVKVSHILTLRYFLPSTLCSGCVTYTDTQVFSPLHFT